VIIASELTKVFRRGGREIRAVHGVSLTLARGEIVGLVGPSGSGKTTLGLMLCGVLRPSAGTVSLAGRGRPVRSQVVFQDPREGLNPRMKVYALVAEPLAVAGAPRREVEGRVKRVMQEVQLDASLLERYPHELSGGQRQRVAIARAVIARPDFVVADEPTAMLDPTVAAGIIRLLKEINRTAQTAFLLISHDLALVAQDCDRIGVLHEGRLVEIGEARRVAVSPASAPARMLVNAARARELALAAAGATCAGSAT
jgi:peptide/nickel transport system ATP-binding protein